MRAMRESPAAANAAAYTHAKRRFLDHRNNHHWATNRRMKCCIDEQRPDQKSEQAPMTCYSQADLVGGRLTVNHAKHRSRGDKLKKCNRCDGAGDYQNKFNVCTDHYRLVRPQSAVLSHPRLLDTVANRLQCDRRLVQLSTWGRGSRVSSLAPSKCFSRCSLSAPSLKSRK